LLLYWQNYVCGKTFKVPIFLIPITSFPGLHLAGVAAMQGSIDNIKTLLRRNIMEERRSERRFAVRWYMRAGHRQVDCVRGKILEISSSGCLFESSHPYRVGDAVEMEIWPGTASPFRVVITVIREASAAPGLYAYGAQFSSLSEESRQILNDALLELRRREFRETFGAGLQRSRAF
jgi:hypothetical protein